MKEIAMRDAFLDELYNIAKEDRRVIVITADFGAPSLDKFRRDLPSQFLSVGIAEQNMISLAAGLALAGKLPFCYAIASFITLRCLEQIKVDLCAMNLPVTLVGVGAGYAYDDSGPTHHALEDIAVMRALPDITILNASDSIMAGAFAKLAYETPGPKYIRLDRTKHQLSWEGDDFSPGFRRLLPGDDLTIIATGYMVKQGIKIAYKLTERVVQESIGTGVIDLYRIKPFNQELISTLATNGQRRVVTLEEGFDGGIGSLISEAINDRGENFKLLRIYSPNKYSFQYSGREEIHQTQGLDVSSVVDRIMRWARNRQ